VPKGTWRTIAADVSPAGVTVFWEVKGQLTPAFTFTAAQIEAGISDHNRQNWPPLAGAVLPAKPWNSRRPLGVFARHSAVAFKDVIVTPAARPQQ
jgi:hypothetical protein